MDKLCKLLGKKLYNEVIKKLNGKKLYLSDNILIPKYRLDEISSKIKEQKLIFEEKIKEYLKLNENLKIECIIYKMVVKSKPKNFDAVIKLINKKNLTINSVENSLKYQIRKLKKAFPQLFFAKKS